jgi:transposase
MRTHIREELIMNNQIVNPLNLPEFRLLQWDENRYDYIFTIELAKEPDFCINCYHDSTIPGNKPLIKHGIKDREVWDIDQHDKRVKLIIKNRRYKCPQCGATFYELINAVPTNGKITNRLYKSIQIKGLKYPFKEIAERYGISNMTVRRAVDDFIEEHDKGRILKAPRVIGIDEAHLNKTFRGVITDIENRQLLEVLPKNTKEQIIACIKSMEGYRNIELATMDMAPAYRYVMRKVAPEALCIIDRFHVVKLVNKAFSDIRVAYRRSLPIEDRRLLMNDKYILEGNKEDLTAAQIERRNMWFARHTPLCIAYWLKEGLRDVYKAKDRYEAYQRYYEWESTIPEQFDKFKTAANSINGCKAEVFNYFLTPVKYTNAYTESINNQIKRIEKDGMGYSFEILRAKCLYGKDLNERPDFGDEGFRNLYKYAPCSNSISSRIRRTLERVTTFIVKIFSRKP